MNTNVCIVPNEEGNLVTPYESNPDFGYMLLKQEKPVNKNGWIRISKKSGLIKGDTEALRDYATSAPNQQLPGNLVVSEYVESEVPESVKKQYYDSSKPYEEQIASYIKRVAKDGIELTLGGERILHFTSHDETGTILDTRVQHDNTEEVSAWLAKNKKEDADIDGK